MMKSAVVFGLLSLLLLIAVHGQRDSVGKRCFCQDAGVNYTSPSNIAKMQVFPSSRSCPNLEIIVTLKHNMGELCLNPSSRFAKNYIKRALAKRNSKENPPM